MADYYGARNCAVVIVFEALAVVVGAYAVFAVLCFVVFAVEVIRGYWKFLNFDADCKYDNGTSESKDKYKGIRKGGELKDVNDKHNS